jgi:lysozyme
LFVTLRSEMVREVPQHAIELIKRFESCRLMPYHDPVGLPTIGYGHLLGTEPWADLNQWQGITQEAAEELLRRDLTRFARAVQALCPVPLSDEQFGALVSFAFNVGAGALKVSSLRQKVLRGEHQDAAEEFMKWVFSRGVKLSGLVRRRAAEQTLYLG